MFGETATSTALREGLSTSPRTIGDKANVLLRSANGACKSLHKCKCSKTCKSQKKVQHLQKQINNRRRNGQLITTADFGMPDASKQIPARMLNRRSTLERRYMQASTPKTSTNRHRRTGIAKSEHGGVSSKSVQNIAERWWTLEQCKSSNHTLPSGGL